MTAPTLSIIVPALNEENRLAASVAEARKAAAEAGIDCEIIVVDDGSTDRTAEIAQSLSASDSRVRLIRNARNLGLGGAYKVGLAAARGTYVTWVPADGAHPADGLVPAYRALGRADIIIPRPLNREVRGRRRRAISSLYTLLVNLITGLDVPYYNGLSIHRTELLRTIRLETDSFGFQAEAIARLLLQGATHEVVDTVITERDSGRTKAFRLKNVLAVGLTLMRILGFSLARRFARASG
jgi:glycosyltransferase involved in cell wall biosynthesis